MPKFFRRRRFLSRAAALCALPIAAPRSGRAQQNAVDDMLRKLTAGAPINAGRVRLEVPALAENGNSVGLKVSVESPMTAAGNVRSVHIYAPRNPRPNIANFYFGPRAGRAQVVTRIRLAGTQNVLAVAVLSDGSFWSDTAEVNVTNSACYDGS